MGFIETGLLASFGLSLLLFSLFRFETARGERFLKHTRNRFDFLVLEFVHVMHVANQTFFKRVLKQSFHFLFHSFLSGIFKLAKATEHKIAHMMRVNRMRAQSTELKNKERNKLEEIALHKIEVALTDEEKRTHKDQMLSGD